jgi:hypothetical protein
MAGIGSVQTPTKSFYLPCSARLPRLEATQTITQASIVHWHATLLHVNVNYIGVGAAAMLEQ